MGDQKTILVVEDSEPLRDALRDTLTREGFSVIMAVNGRKGLKKALEMKPSLIVLDILMPEMDGMTMLQELRKNDWGKAVSVIVLTNLDADSEELMNKISETHPTYYFQKTTKTLDELVITIKDLLKN